MELLATPKLNPFGKQESIIFSVMCHTVNSPEVHKISATIVQFCYYNQKTVHKQISMAVFQFVNGKRSDLAN